MNQENFYDIIARYLDGSASREEAEILLDWLKADKQNMKLFIGLKDIWLKTGTLNTEDKETEAALLRFKSRVEYTYSSSNLRRIAWMKYGNIAAILIIAILTGALLFNRVNNVQDLSNSFTETIIPLGQKGQVILADGTKISLNSGSKLRYPLNFNGTAREVFLEGEAYFDVAHNKEKPFLVHSGKLTVKVLGTVFNLKAYSGDNRIETTLISGSVKILERNDKKSAEVATLQPNEQAIYNSSNGQISVNQFHATEPTVAAKPYKTNEPVKLQVSKIETVTMWKDQKLVFLDETMDEMAQKLTRWYGKKVNIESENLKVNRYSGKFIYNETIYQVLEVLSLTTDLTYYEKDHEIYIKTK